MSRLDHLVYAVPELRAGCDELERLLGVRPAPGGRHAQWGTANALLALGPDVYLEVVGPDPEATAAPTVFGLDVLDAPGLVAWAVRVRGIEGEEMSRLRPDGTELRWRMAPPRTGAIPFLLDWGDSPHPAEALLAASCSSPSPSRARSRARGERAAGARHRGVRHRGAGRPSRGRPRRAGRPDRALTDRE